MTLISEQQPSLDPDLIASLGEGSLNIQALKHLFPDIQEDDVTLQALVNNLEKNAEQQGLDPKILFFEAYLLETNLVSATEILGIIREGQLEEIRLSGDVEQYISAFFALYNVKYGNQRKS